MKSPVLELIAVSVSVLTLALMYQKHKVDIRMAEDQKDLRELQAELYKQQIAQFKNGVATA